MVTPLWFREATKAPQYAVIAELGSHDYYQRRSTENPPLIGDVMWMFDRKQWQAQAKLACSSFNLAEIPRMGNPQYGYRE